MLDLTRPPTRLMQILPDDCCRTAIAMVLGMNSVEDVPHSKTWDDKDDWLRRRGAQLVHVPLPCKTPECVEEHLANYLSGCPGVLTGQTNEGNAHAVAIIDDQIVDTVDWTVGNPLRLPCSDGFYWLSLIVPMREKAP